jgi:hypothetical protein
MYSKICVRTRVHGVKWRCTLHNNNKRKQNPKENKHERRENGVARRTCSQFVLFALMMHCVFTGSRSRNNTLVNVASNALGVHCVSE